jgi:hypothetical protein
MTDTKLLRSRLESQLAELLDEGMSKRTNKTSKRQRRLPYGADFGSSSINVIGNPMTATGEPVVREATLDDIEDDCVLCQALRKQIESGNPPQVMVFE